MRAARWRSRPAFAQLREWAVWWDDTGKLTPCCLTADREVVETDAQEFQCDTCEVKARREALDPENVRAVDVFGRCVTRFCRETQTSALVLKCLTAQDSPEQVVDLVARLDVLYDVFVPVPVTHGT